ncbi:MAG TPA: hypothetical protein VL485_10335 [Ktedonobacteraceae bacterium]|jgi:hypothetical protein|nr:hypothetical protein [Ktedonobacteraceae bacterium]
MINPDWQLVDLDPVTWRHLGHFFAPGQYVRSAQPGEHGLFVLHEQGTVLRIVDSESGLRRDIVLDTITDPQQSAQQLYASGEWQRVHIVDKAHLAHVARTAQSNPQREKTLDQYYHSVYQLLWGEPAGYVSIPPHPGHWHGWTYAYLQDVISGLPVAPASLALGVLADGRWQIGLILICEGGRINKVTTFEALEAQSVKAELSEESLEALWKNIAETLATPAGLLLCSQAVFDTWIQQEEKLQVLQEARKQGEAYWRWGV